MIPIKTVFFLIITVFLVLIGTIAACGLLYQSWSKLSQTGSLNGYELLSILLIFFYFLVLFRFLLVLHKTRKGTKKVSLGGEHTRLKK